MILFEFWDSWIFLDALQDFVHVLFPKKAKLSVVLTEPRRNIFDIARCGLPMEVRVGLTVSFTGSRVRNHSNTNLLKTLRRDWKVRVDHVASPVSCHRDEPQMATICYNQLKSFNHRFFSVKV